MHDIGKSVLSLKFPDRYGSLLKMVQGGAVLDESQAEMGTFGFDHSMVGEALALAWNLPDAFAQCVRWHHSPTCADSECKVLTAYVTLGNLFALEMGKGAGVNRDRAGEKRDALKITGISEFVFASLRESILECLEMDEVLIAGF